MVSLSYLSLHSVGCSNIILLMAVRAETHLKLQTVGKSIAWMNASPEQSKISSKKLRQKGSKKVSIEMMCLTEDAMHCDPHELAQEGELEMLKARLELTDLSIKVRDKSMLLFYMQLLAKIK